MRWAGLGPLVDLLLPPTGKLTTIVEEAFRRAVLNNKT